jgi:hypothetical protein
LVFRFKRSIDEPVGASPQLALCYPPHGIGSGIGGSLRASLFGSLRGSLVIRFRGSLIGSVRGRGGGNIEDRLRGRPGSSLRVSQQGSLWTRLGGRLVGRLRDLFYDEKLFGFLSKSQEIDSGIYSLQRYFCFYYSVIASLRSRRGNLFYQFP